MISVKEPSSTQFKTRIIKAGNLILRCNFRDFTRERFSFEARVKLITPTQSAGFTRATKDSTSDQTPIPRAQLIHKLRKHRILLRRRLNLLRQLTR
ncbi:unnamed protein product [Microthlaspi erraticum]|uniref:Uncharacterized protein n=1 Tax=Microthlaspi erraticum TaxID=1685480 RepID=A0A6D2K6B1_9BRAS|nr:unnamed protein product [Microthlaspi erraticum]